MIKKMSFVIANPLKRMKQSLFLSSRPRIRGINIQQESSLSFRTYVRNLKLSLRCHAVSSLPGVSSIRRSSFLAAISIFFSLPSFVSAQEKIPVFPATPVEAYTVYGSLALFWLAIIFLIIVIKMKLNEIERIQKLGIDKEDENAPILE